MKRTPARVGVAGGDDTGDDEDPAARSGGGTEYSEVMECRRGLNEDGVGGGAGRTLLLAVS